MIPIPEIDDVSAAFPANALDWMPAYNDIPEVDSRWNNLAYEWFYRGLPDDTVFIVKDGVDSKKALKAIKATLGSFAPKHEHKMAAVAFMLSEWFEDVLNWEKESAAVKP